MKQRGFSLMEMMIVLLIVAIIAAASAPMVSKKMMRDAEGGSPWMYAGLGGSITYNPDGNQNKTAMVGTGTLPSNAGKSKFYIESSSSEPQIALGTNGSSNVMRIQAKNSSIIVSNNTSNTIVSNGVGIGSGVVLTGGNGTAIGYRSNSSGTYTTALGARATAGQTGAVAIGYYSGGSTGGGQYSTSVGYQSEARGENALALGCSSNAGGTSSIAIGDSVMANANNSIAIGRGSSAGYNAISIGTNITAGGAISIGRDIKKPSSCSIILGNASMQAGDNSITIGYGDNSQANHKAVAIGYESNATGLASVAVGAESHATSNYSIAIGSHCSSKYNSTNTIAMGLYSSAGSYSVAIGDRAKAYNSNAVAIGVNAATTADKQIVLGTSSDTVYIPGNLVVNKNVYLTGSCRNASDDDTELPLYIRDMRSNTSTPQAARVFSKDHYLRIRKENNTVSLSDRRLKNVGEVFSGGLDKIKQLKVYNYTFKNDETKTPRVGVMAQDLQRVFPDAVTKGEDGFLRIRWEDMFYALINAVKELDLRITAENMELKNRVTKLEKENKELEARLSKLEKSFTTK